MYKKGLTIAVIFLFVAVSFQPILATKSFQDEKSDLVEVVVQTCNLNGGQNHTKYLTQQQVQQLKDLFDTIYKKLDNSKNREETIEIFNNAVLSINELGLLPGDMTVEEAQKLVTGGEQNPKVIKLLERWYNKHEGSLDDNQNVLCYMAGNTTETLFCGPVFSLLYTLAPRLMFIFKFLTFLFPYAILPFLFWNKIPINLGYEIGLGYHFQWMYGNYDVPATGQIHTSGLNGAKSWNESFYGNLSIGLIQLVVTDYFPGVFGFTGIDFVLDNGYYDTHFYIGFALKVKIDYILSSNF